MKIALRKIADVQSGYSFRSKLELQQSGNIAVIQMKDLTSANRVCCDSLAKIDMEMPKGHHLVKPGDLIFRSRGLTTNSAILADDPGVAVLSAPLLLIRVTSDRVIPEYINWYINQRPAQLYLTSCAEGTALKMISKQSLEQLEVQLPPIDKQRLIVELSRLVEDEQRILKELAEKRRHYISAMLLHVAQGA